MKNLFFTMSSGFVWSFISGLVPYLPSSSVTVWLVTLIAALVCLVVYQNTTQKAQKEEYEIVNKKRAEEHLPPVIEEKSLPYLGHLFVYSKSFAMFCKKWHGKFGNCFSFDLMWMKWHLFSSDEDVELIGNMGANISSLGKTYREFLSSVMPKNNFKYSCEFSKRIFDLDVTEVTPFYIRGLKVENLRLWTPIFYRYMTEESFPAMMKTLEMTSGKSNSNSPATAVDLFEWTRDLITCFTLIAAIGDEAVKDPTWLKKWKGLFIEADPETMFSSPWKTIVAYTETFVFGERRVFGRVRALFDRILNEKIEAALAGDEEKLKGIDLMTCLVVSWHKKLPEDQKHLLRESKVRICHDLFGFIFAAVTNSFAAAAWIMWHYLNNSQGFGDKVRDQMASVRVLGGESENEKAIPTLDKLEELTYIQNAILEISRLYQMGPALRKLEKDVTFSNEIVIPAGHIVGFSMYMVGRDEKHFPNATHFDIGRGDRGEYKEAKMKFAPFGGGKHPCVGKRFAMMEIALFVVCALEKFEMRLLDVKPTSDREKKYIISNVENHPDMLWQQAGSFWRPAQPVMVELTTRQRSSGK